MGHSLHFIALLAAVTSLALSGCLPFNRNSDRETDAEGELDNCDGAAEGKIVLTNLVSRFPSSANRKGLDPAMREPTQMDFVSTVDSLGRLAVNIFWTERPGKVKFYDALTGKIQVIGSIPTTYVKDLGLFGIALDNNFKTSRWMYLYYTVKNESEFRLSRFTLNGEKRIKMESEKVIMAIPNPYSSKELMINHPSGHIMFDNYGDLWVAVGNCGVNHDFPYDTAQSEMDIKMSDEWGPSNTANYRGSILRIHPEPFPDTETPEPGIGRTYSIPQGNFGEYWANRFELQGERELAQEYRNPEKVLPEIYSKGHRSNFSITVDPIKRILTWGENNPNSNHDEFNIVDHPVFAGYPYFIGYDTPMTYSGQNPESPINNSKWNTGVKRLPPAFRASYSYQSRSAAAMTGPIYRYDDSLDSRIKLPSSYDGKWFVAEFMQSWVRMLTLDDRQEKVIESQEAFPGLEFKNPIDLRFGPDGALYILNYAGYYSPSAHTGLVRVEYAKACHESGAN